MNRDHFFKRPSNAMVRIFNFRAYFSLLTCIKATGEGGGGGWRGYSTNVYMLIRGGSAPRSNSLHFYKPFFYVKGTRSFDKWYQFHRPYFELCIPFNQPPGFAAD